jgi:GTPase SAR1 family protein
LDPANDCPAYECAVDVRELINLTDVMDELHLGPNGGLVYCMEHLQQNLDWLREKLRPLETDAYLLFDLPGQVELFMMHDALKAIVEEMVGQWSYRLTAVHLVRRAPACVVSLPGCFSSRTTNPRRASLVRW